MPELLSASSARNKTKAVLTEHAAKVIQSQNRAVEVLNNEFLCLKKEAQNIIEKACNKGLFQSIILVQSNNSLQSLRLKNAMHENGDISESGSMLIGELEKNGYSCATKIESERDGYLDMYYYYYLIISWH